MGSYGRLVHAGGTSSDLPPFLHAFQFTPAVRLGLAHHVIIIVGLASCPNEEGGTEERRRACSNLLDLRDVIRKRGGINEGLLVESALN